MLLEVQKLSARDVYKDVARLPEVHRKDPQGRRIPEGRICVLSVEGRTTLVSVQGLVDESRSLIRIDEKTRSNLGVVPGKEYYFDLVRVSMIQQVWWAWNASDPTTRLAARINV